MLAPTLIIGLGGTGAKIVAKVAAKITKEQSSHIRCVVFDTDVNELNQIKKEYPMVKTVQTSTKLSVNEYLTLDKHANDNWFPRNPILGKKTLTEGAGQVRAISRLAVDTAIRAGNMEALHKAVEELNQLNSEDEVQQALRVTIVGSLAGGTGSGLILPVALYVKNFLTTRFRASANIVRGFFILPEVFYEVIPGEPERNNLRCNAYATLREIDAFQMRGDGMLPKKYKNLKCELPRPGSAEYDDYKITPYDFCFLFDAQNKDGKKLNSFEEYLDHACNCIYAQSIGPMNKRSNSSEDNVIRELCGSGGRSRYCGAGSSMLVYPYEDIKKYLALQWAKDSVSEKWVVFDKKFKAQKQKMKKMESQGIFAAEVSAGNSYIMEIEAGDINKDAFAMAIRNACSNLDEDGMRKPEEKWEEYVGQLGDHVSKLIPQVQSDVEKLRNASDMALKRLSNTKQGVEFGHFQEAYTQLARYRNISKKRCEETARSVAYTIFDSDGDVTKEGFAYQFETYLRNARQEFIHPNAVRYFIYKTEESLYEASLGIKNELEELTENIDEFENQTFDNPETEKKETIADYQKKLKMSLVGKVTHSLNDTQKRFAEAMRTMHDSVMEYREKTIYLAVLEEAMKYTKKIGQAFESFYSIFDAKAANIEKEIHKIETNYQNLQGHAVRYVCASEKCLKKIASDSVYTGDSLSLPGDLCSEIYMKVREYALRDDTPEASRFFSDVFNKAIIGYFQDSVVEKCDNLINVDVLTALENEAAYEHQLFEEEKIEDYVRKVINGTRVLASPFIESPLGEQRQPVRACAFSKAVYREGDRHRKDIVDHELKNGGGVADDDMDKSMIIFYDALYGIKASDLSKFSSKNGGGEYFKAYFDLVDKIKPVLETKAVITPHIDRTWHSISCMPDLDEENQLRMERKIYKAMILGLIFGKIGYRPIIQGKNLYRILVDEKPKDFVVSNHTPCDRYYEILDALTINPVVVEQVLESAAADIAREKDQKILFEDSCLKKNLSNFMLKEFDENQKSIFDLAMLLKVSTPTIDFVEEEGLEFMRTALDVIYDYMADCCPEEKLLNEYGDFIFEQYKIFCQNTSWYVDNWKDNIGTFRDDILDITISRFKKLELYGLAEVIVEDLQR